MAIVLAINSFTDNDKENSEFMVIRYLTFATKPSVSAFLA